jgi:peptide-N4-(N-acetyl-beta-glucosaminyl)asparagine amidase
VEKARGVVPAAALVRSASAAAAAAAAAAGGGGVAPPPPPFRLHLLRALLGWFKGSFFKWVNGVPCGSCGGGTAPSGGAPPTPAEREGGRAGVVELHRCSAPGCGAVTRFPRFNAPGVLLDTRRGRCGEWTNAFVALALALGFEARHVTDFTDHVWAEVRVARAGGEAPAWLHADPCEAALDTPLLYEKGWGKKLSFVFAAGFAGFRDVTRRCACVVAPSAAAAAARSHTQAYAPLSPLPPRHPRVARGAREAAK